MQTDRQWYSARVQLVAIVEPGRANSVMDSIHVFRASDWDDALRRAVALGRGHEQEYVNADGDRVQWRLREVLSLDLIRADDIDGAEVHSAISDVTADDALSLATELHPERSRPAQTI